MMLLSCQPLTKRLDQGEVAHEAFGMSYVKLRVNKWRRIEVPVSIIGALIERVVQNRGAYSLISSRQRPGVGNLGGQTMPIP